MDLVTSVRPPMMSAMLRRLLPFALVASSCISAAKAVESQPTRRDPEGAVRALQGRSP